MSKKSKAPTSTLVTFLLDRSSSMGAIWQDTIDGFNAYIETLKKGEENIKFTRLQFDFRNGCEIQKDCVAEPVASVPLLNQQNYQPRGSTPLIEAAHKTIEAVEASLKSYDKAPNVIVCIQTDGQENSSNAEYTWAGLKALIEAKTKAGWVFNFMGTGIDAYAQGAQMGIAAANTMSTGTSREHVRASYAAMGASNMRYAATGLSASAAFLSTERANSGDRFARTVDLTSGPKVHAPHAPAWPTGAQPLPSSAPLDLTTGGSGASFSRTTGLDLTPSS